MGDSCKVEDRKMPCQKALDELRELHLEFLALGTSVEELVTEALRPLRGLNAAGRTSVGAGDALAEQGQRIADRCRRIVLLYQPMGIDFREVTAVLRMAAELEHIGDRATEITERSGALSALLVHVPPELSRLAEAVAGMLHRFLDAFTLLDVVPVQPVACLRTEVRGLAGVLTQWLAGVMRADPNAVESGLNLCVVIQNLQRIAEHATTLAEEVTFLTEAKSTRLGANNPVTVPREPAHANSSG
jgi:phosphate transport system protein